jgi:uncharacterized protein (TIGR00369 family)
VATAYLALDALCGRGRAKGARVSRPVNDEVVRSLVRSPLEGLLGMQVEAIDADHVRVRLPFRTDVTTGAGIVHGGAISALIDTAATAAAWSAADLSSNPRGTTVALAINFLAQARGLDIVADARVIRRGRTITICEVAVGDASGGRIASALVTYKLS